MRNFPFITATVCLIIGAKFHDEIAKLLKDLPVIGDWFKTTSA